MYAQGCAQRMGKDTSFFAIYQIISQKTIFTEPPSSRVIVFHVPLLARIVITSIASFISDSEIHDFSPIFTFFLQKVWKTGKYFVSLHLVNAYY